MTNTIYPSRPNKTLRSKSSMPEPPEEIRQRVTDTALPWYQWVERYSEEAKAFYCMINHILSSITGTHLNDLRTILKHRYLFPLEIVENLIQMLIMNDFKHVEFEQDKHARKPYLYLSPRSNNITVIGGVLNMGRQCKVKGKEQREQMNMITL